MPYKNPKVVAVRVLGQPSAALPDYSASFPSRGFALLALLVLDPGRRLSRAVVADKIWNNSSDNANLANLRQLMRRVFLSKPDMRNIIGSDSRAIWIESGTNLVDLQAFLDLNSVGSTEGFRNLIDLYRGSLLDGMSFNGSRLDADLPEIRTHLVNRYFSLMENGLEELTRYGRADMSLVRDIEQHALTVDPDREATYRALMQSYQALNRDTDVRRLYAALEKRVDRIGTGTRMILRTPGRRMSASGSSERNQSAEVTPSFEPRIAVLAPILDGGQKLEGQLARSFVEDLANELSRDTRFRALAPHSSFKAASDGGVILENRKLRADYTVYSKFREGPGLGCISARLVDMSNDAILWSDNLDLGDGTMFLAGRRLVRRVTVELTSHIEKHYLARVSETLDHSAYVNFLIGQRVLKTCDLKSVRRARRHFLEALRQEDRYAESYSGVSFSLYLEWLLTGGNDPRLLGEARQLADSAIRCSPKSSSGYWRKAMVALYQHDFETSEECFELAHELHPNSADILLDQSDALGFVGDPNHAWRLFERALDLNPLPPEHYWWAGASIAFSKADYTQAIKLCDCLENDEPVLRLLASCHGQLGNKAEARNFGQRLKESYPGQTAEEMTRLQPHRTPQDLEPFIEGLRLAGLT